MKKSIRILEDELDANIKKSDFDKASEVRAEVIELKSKLEKLRKNSSLAEPELVLQPENIADVLSQWTGIPLSKLSGDEESNLVKMEEVLRKSIKGFSFARFGKKQSEVQLASLGNDAGIIGAALLWKNETNI